MSTVTRDARQTDRWFAVGESGARDSYTAGAEADIAAAAFDVEAARAAIAAESPRIQATARALATLDVLGSLAEAARPRSGR